jgi:hypothetical protein
MDRHARDVKVRRVREREGIERWFYRPSSTHTRCRCSRFLRTSEKDLLAHLRDILQ